MPTMDDYLRRLEEGDLDSPSPGYGRTTDIRGEDLPWSDISRNEKDIITQPLVDYHNAMNNFQMSGPAREGRETILMGNDEQDVYPYGTMFPTFPERPATDAFDVNYYPGEFDQINDYFRNRAGISRAQTSGYKDPNMTPGFSLAPNPQDWQTINQAAGLPAFPTRVAPPQQTGLFDDIQNFYRNIFQ
jgi:hypothetical protein